MMHEFKEILIKNKWEFDEWVVNIQLWHKWTLDWNKIVASAHLDWYTGDWFIWIPGKEHPLGKGQDLEQFRKLVEAI